MADTFPIASTPDPLVFTDWTTESAALWGNHPARLSHSLHHSPLFSRTALAELVSAYPREHYSLVETGGLADKQLWREGDKGQLSGEQVIAAIERGRMWLNLRHLVEVDPRYRTIVDAIFDELAWRIPGFRTHSRVAGILISSPGAQVYYHADLPGQCLWQIVGTKRVHVYPPYEPFLSARTLEDIALFDMELGIPYEPWFDRHATVIDLNPGDMATWGLNAPHRVENMDCLNISMTISYSTDEIRRLNVLHMANGILRHRFGVEAPSRSTKGPTFLFKRALQRVMRNASWIASARRQRREVTFTLTSDAAQGAAPREAA